MRRFFISDMHFGHENIIKYENRPFVDCDNMEKEITENWNNTVSNSDMVFVLGDVLWGRNGYVDLINNLNGRKILVMGNHDTLSPKSYERMGFEMVSKWPIILDDFYICSHAPVYLCDAMPYANIHGHIHSKTMEGGAYFNVSVEQIKYTPINFEEIKNRLRNNGK